MLHNHALWAIFFQRQLKSEHTHYLRLPSFGHPLLKPPGGEHVSVYGTAHRKAADPESGTNDCDARLS